MRKYRLKVLDQYSDHHDLHTTPTFSKARLKRRAREYRHIVPTAHIVVQVLESKTWTDLCNWEDFR